MAVRIDKKLLWHPRNDNKFIVGGGSQITLYEWVPDVPEFRLVTSQANLQLMKCFAWSPDPIFDDLVAVGSSTGKVELWRLGSNRFARNNIVPGGSEVSLPVRNSRSCNALAFSSVNPNILAVGLDKVRGDSSLVVWDVRGTSGSASSSATLQPHRIQQFAPTEVISSVAFLPSSADLLLAGVSNLWLRLFDLRVNATHVAQAAAVKVHGIIADPFNTYRFACYGEGAVTVWDSRKISHPLLTFTLRDATADGARFLSNDPFNCVEFSPVRSGVLATLNRDSNYVRFWDIQQTPSFESVRGLDDQRSRDSPKEASRSSKLPRLSWTTSSTILPWNAPPEQVCSPSEIPPGVQNAILSDTRRTKAFSRPIVSFALTPSPFTHPLSSNVVVVNKEGDIEMYAFHDVPKHSVWSPRGDLLVGAGKSYRVFPGFQDPDPPLEPWEIEFNSETIGGVERNIGGRSDLKGKSSRPHSRLGDANNAGSVNGEKDRAPATTPSIRESTLTATRHTKGRTFSPASIRRYSMDYNAHRDALAPLSSEVHGIIPPSPRREFANLHETTLQLANKGRRIDPSRSASRGRKRAPDTNTPTAVENDISMLMRSRVLLGYGILNVAHNAKLLGSHPGSDSVLAEVWGWLNHSKQLLTFGTSKVHGIDFSYQGVLGIWEGLEATSSHDFGSLLDGLDLAGSSESTTSTLHETATTVDVDASLRPRLSSHKHHSFGDGFHGNYSAALNALNSRSELDKSMFKPTVHTNKSQQRRLALALCDWKVGEDEFARWEKEGRHSQAACWLLFTNQGGRAIEVLMRSKVESHQMMSGTFASLLQSGSSMRNHELRDHCQRLIVKLQDPHFRIMLSYIVFNDWSDVLEEEALPLRERIAIALRFLDDKELSSYLRRVTDECRVKGSIEGLVMTGLTPRGLDIIQSYVDTTGDVQTAAVLASHVYPGKYRDARAERWMDAYCDFLDGLKLFHFRCQFDIDRGKLLQEGIQSGDITPMEWVKKQFLIRCNFCNKVVNSHQEQRPQEPMAMQRRRAAACPWCGRALPRCSVCLMSVSIVPDSGRENDLLHSSFRDTIDDAFIFCQACRHGGHAEHVIEWFFGEDGDSNRPRRTCPVADCECYCDEGNNVR